MSKKVEEVVASESLEESKEVVVEEGEQEDLPVEIIADELLVEAVEEEQQEGVDGQEVKVPKNINKGDWYIIQTYSSQEYKVKRSLEQRILNMKLQDRIFEILIPEEDIIEVKNNKKLESTKKMYPGYIFVKMEFDEDLWYIMKRIPGLSKFMGNQNTPIPVKDDEMLKVLRQVGVKVQKYQIDFEVGDMIKIIAGPFRGYTGPVKDINAEKGKLKSMILIFGRETPVEIDFDQVEKASK